VASLAHQLSPHLADRCGGSELSNQGENIDGDQPPTVVTLEGQAMAALDDRLQGPFVDQLNDSHGPTIPCSLFVLKQLQGAGLLRPLLAGFDPLLAGFDPLLAGFEFARGLI